MLLLSSHRSGRRGIKSYLSLRINTPLSHTRRASYRRARSRAHAKGPRRPFSPALKRYVLYEEVEGYISGILNACVSECCVGRSFLSRSRAESVGPPFLLKRSFLSIMGSLPSPEGVSRSSTMGRGSRFAGMGSPRVVPAGRGPLANGKYQSNPTLYS